MTTSRTSMIFGASRNALGEEGSSLTIEPLAKERALSERVYRVILQMLARGALKRGSTLRIDLLSKALNVSPTPVREALARLAPTGLVVHEPRKGYSVAPPLTRIQLTELMDARRLIEIGAIRYACINGGAEFRTELLAALEAQRAAVRAFRSQPDSGTADEEGLAWNVIESDLHFHQVIVEHTKNRFIGVMAEALSAQLHRVRQSTERGISDDMPALNEHEKIVTAVVAGDRAAAERAMNEHLDNLEKRSEADLDVDDESTAQG